MSFNKIREILAKGGNEATIRKALSRSEVLEMSEDHTKVRRKEEIAIKTPEEMDDCTLYVEQVPINSTHDSLKELFSRFGKVVYVSLPRYKKSQKIKQFGFVEFEEKESIIKAINTFKRCDNVLQYAIVKAENLLSIATHEKETEEKAEDKNDEKSEEKVEKVEDEMESDEPPTKKVKVDEESDKVEEMQEESETETSKVSEKETEDEEKHDDEDGTIKKKKKNRKHKKKSKSNTLVDQHILAMKIMRKKDWKKMRNEYLNMERQKAKEIKKILRDSYNKRNNNKIQESPKISHLSTASPKINFYNYGSPIGQEERNEPEPIETNQTSGLIFTQGVIVNIKFREPCSEFKELKKEFKQFSYVNYVDILEGGSQCYIRVDNPSSAQELVSQYSSCEYETEVLKDEAEKEYWKKIFEKRDASKNNTAPRKSNPVRRRRGRERLLDKIQKAGTHVRFEVEVEENVE